MSDETYTANLESCTPSDCASCTANCSSAGGQNQGTIPNVPNPTIKLTLDDDSVLECAVLRLRMLRCFFFNDFPGGRIWGIHCVSSFKQRWEKYYRRNLSVPLCRRK